MMLGTVCWFMVASEGVHHEQLAGWLQELGFPAALTPKRPEPREAYRKATSEAKARYDLADGMRATVTVTQTLRQDREQLVRALVRQITRPDGRSLYHDQVGEAIFDRAELVSRRRVPGSERLRVTLDHRLLADYERPHLERLVDQVRDRYDYYCTHVDGDRLRELVRRLLAGLRALRLSPGGPPYFVAAARVGELRRVRMLADRAGVLLRWVPAVDIAEVRTMLAEALHQQAVYQAELLASNFHDDLRHRGMLPSTTRVFQQRIDELLAGLTEHAELLGVELPGQVADALDPVLERLGAA
jgi:hypothetical protein